ncbi:MAG: NAD(P)H-binding protein [Hyphomicrobiaceae bacterium]
MRILITGATGLIGSHVARRITRAGHAVVGVARSPSWAREHYPDIEWVEGDFRSDTTAAQWRPRLKEIDAVVNCAGVLQDGGGDNLQDVHVNGAAALFAACEELGVRRVVQISAAGADENAPTEFMRSKAEGDQRLMARQLEWVILRPAFVIGRGVYGGTALIRGLAGFPFVTPVADGSQAIQTVDISDVAETVAFCLGPRAPHHQVLTLAHPERLTLEQVVRQTRRWLGFGERATRPVAKPVAELAYRVGDLLGHLGWRSPMRTTARQQLADGVVGDPSHWIAVTGIRPLSFQDWLQRSPSTVQDRWHARLYFLKPVVIAALSLVWIFSGLVALGPGFGAAVEQLRHAGFGPGTAQNLTVVTGLIDLGLGLAILNSRWLKPAAIGMAVTSVFYLLAATVLAPELWLDPLGPIVKIVGLIVLPLVALALAESR